MSLDGRDNWIGLNLHAMAAQRMSHGAIISDYAVGAPPEAANFPLTRVPEQCAAGMNLPTDETEVKLLSALGDEALHVDVIRNQTGLPVEKVPAALVMMELKGIVRHVGGIPYVVVCEAQSDYSTKG